MSIDFTAKYNKFNEQVNRLEKKEDMESTDLQGLCDEAIDLTKLSTDKTHWEALNGLTNRIRPLLEKSQVSDVFQGVFKSCSDLSELWRCQSKLMQSSKMTFVEETSKSIQQDVHNGLKNLAEDLHIAKVAISRSEASSQLDLLTIPLDESQKDLAVHYLSEFENEQRAVILDFASANCQNGEELLAFLDFAFINDDAFLQTPNQSNTEKEDLRKFFYLFHGDVYIKNTDYEGGVSSKVLERFSSFLKERSLIKEFQYLSNYVDLQDPKVNLRGKFVRPF